MGGMGHAQALCLVAAASDYILFHDHLTQHSQLCVCVVHKVYMCLCQRVYLS